jgi:hypothetical protein
MSMRSACIFVGATWFLAQVAAQSAEFEVSGREVYLAAGSAYTVKRELNFRVCVAGTNWLVELNGGELQRDWVERIVVATDHTNVYILKYRTHDVPWESMSPLLATMNTRGQVEWQEPSKSSTSLSLPASKKPINFGGNCEIFSGEVPPCNGNMAAVPWMAYASAPYLCTLKTKYLTPIWPVQYPPEIPALFRADWETFDDVFRLPTRVSFYSDGTGFAISAAGNYALQRAREPYDRGFLKAMYEVESYTNVSGIFLPVKARLTRFREAPEGKSNSDLVVVDSLQIEADIFSAKSSVTNFVPPPVPNSIITDWRFRHLGSGFPESVAYLVDTPKEWPAMEEVKRSAAYNRELNRLRPPHVVGVAPGWSLKRAALLCMLALPLCGTIAAISFKLQQKPTKHTNQI